MICLYMYIYIHKGSKHSNQIDVICMRSVSESGFSVRRMEQVIRAYEERTEVHFKVQTIEKESVQTNCDLQKIKETVRSIFQTMCSSCIL